MFLSDSAPMIFKICSMKQFEPNEFHITRIYPYSVLILMLDGVLRFYENGKLIELRKDEYYIQQAGLLQEGMNSRKPVPHNRDPLPVYFFIEFQGGAFSETKSGIPIRGSFRPEVICPIISACELAYSDGRLLNLFLMNSYMYRIFGELSMKLPNERQIFNLLSMVKKHIDSEYFSISGVQDIAQKFGYNTDHLTKLFIQKYHLSIYRYLIDVRMEHALWLLQNTNMSLGQISSSVGYDNYSSFYRMFTETYHASPQMMRKKKTDKQ